MLRQRFIIAIGSAAIHFWLLTQNVFAEQQLQQQSSSAVASSRFHLTAGKAVSQDNTDTTKDIAATVSYCRRPVCATSNGIDFVLFSSSCLLRETNRERHLGPDVFREIGLGACRPDCNVICGRTTNRIASRNQRPLCALETGSGRNLRFDSECDYARHICLSEGEWIQMDAVECAMVTTRPRATMPTSIKTATATTPIMQSGLGPKASTVKRKLKARKSMPCAKVFNPVCATFAGVRSTFINECLVNEENVKTGADWKIFASGMCAEDYASSPPLQGTIKQRARGRRSLLDSDAISLPYIVRTKYGNDVYEGAQSQPSQGNAELSYTSLRDNSAYKLPISLPIRIIGVVDDKVPVCKFGAGSICGTSVVGAHTFGNVCELMLRNIMHNQTWSVLHEGPCQMPCVLNCNKEFNPICVSRNYVNYTIANECYLKYSMCRDKRSTWKIISNGRCESATTNQYSTSNNITPTTTQATTILYTKPSPEPKPINVSTAATPIITFPTRPTIATTTREPTPTTTTPTPPTTPYYNSAYSNSGLSNGLYASQSISPPLIWLYPPIINTARYLIKANGLPYLVSSSSNAPYGAHAFCPECAGAQPSTSKQKRGVIETPPQATHIMNLARKKCRCSRKSRKMSGKSKSRS